MQACCAPAALQGEAALQFKAARGASDLRDDINRIGPDHNFTRLVPDLSAGAAGGLFCGCPDFVGALILWGSSRGPVWAAIGCHPC